jgi:hypothetical protein
MTIIGSANLLPGNTCTDIDAFITVRSKREGDR